MTVSFRRDEHYGWMTANGALSFVDNVMQQFLLRCCGPFPSTISKAGCIRLASRSECPMRGKAGKTVQICACMRLARDMQAIEVAPPSTFPIRCRTIDRHKIVDEAPNLGRQKIAARIDSG